MSYYKKQNSGLDGKAKMVLIFVVVIAVIAFGKKLLNKFSSGFALLGAKNEGNKIYDDMNNPSPTGVRLPFIKTTMDSVRKEINSFNQDEAEIVKLMNSLANGQEVAAASSYYHSAYSRSLRTELKDALDSGWNPFGYVMNTTWNDLKDYVKNNVV